MSDEFGVDLDEVYKVIDAADVLVVRFHIVPKRLLVDFWTRPGAGPLVKMVEPATSVEERFRSIKELRPQFPLPEKVMSFQWPRMTAVLVSSGVWDYLVNRIVAVGGDELAADCARVLDEITAAERVEVANAIRGSEHYQTLWERQGA
jgi:hypothetical protein